MCFEYRPKQVEMGSKNHEVVPSVLIVQISGLRNGGVNKLLGSLAQRNLVARVQNAKCEMATSHQSVQGS
jgi:RIO-like serine/threonine protein kinase